MTTVTAELSAPGLPALHEEPWLVGDPLARTFSTSAALVPSPLLCWDVNGYYRELGVDWRAGKAELRRAYLALDGQRSPRLTYVLAQLLDPATRRAYDRAPLGSQFRDLYVDQELWRSLVGQAGGDDDLLRFLAGAVGMDLADALDEGSLEDQDEGAPPEQDHFPYAYYLWRAQHPDPGLLRTWQALLVRAASERGVVAQVAVGVMGRTPHRWVGITVGYVEVLMINQDVEPTEEMAHLAIDWLNHRPR
jgi:hypothetical protein